MVPFIILLLVLVLVVVPLWTVIRMLALGRENEAIAQELAGIKAEVRELRQKLGALSTPPPSPLTTAVVASARTDSPPVRVAPDAPPALSPVVASPASATAAPPQPAPVPLSTPPSPPPLAKPAAPPPLAPPPVRPPVARPRIDWEQFMGAKFFAWTGGVAAFLGAVFFVRYSFEHDLIPAEVRVALGFLFGLALIVAGLKFNRERYAALVHTLCATGVVSLYAVTFACNSIYHFAFFGPLATFALMTLITGVAFLLAVRLEARVVAVLGMLGGFLTPVLLSTGRDNAAGLFAYVALLDAGLIAVALHRRWHFLVSLGAAGTVLMQAGWAEKFLTAAKAPTAMTVGLAFCFLFLGAFALARRYGSRGETDAGGTTDPVGVPWAITGSALAFPLVAFAFALGFLFYPAVAARPGLLFTFVALADVCLLALAWFEPKASRLHLVGGAAVFAVLALWTGWRLTPELLPWALAFYLLHAVLHTTFPLVLARRRPEAATAGWSQLFPPLALGLMMLPLFKLDAVSLLYWPCVLLIDLLAIGLALASASLTAVAAVLVLTLCATGIWIFNATTVVTASSLLVLGGFAILFFVAGLFLARRLGDRLPGLGGPAAPVLGDARSQIPAFSALLPFLLLILLTQRLDLANPSPIFGLALLLVVLTLGLARIFTLAWLPACALAGVGALEFAWRARAGVPAEPVTPLLWFVLFHAVFSLYPFIFRRRFQDLTGPWAVAALAGVVQFPLVHRLIERAWPNDFPGVVPALFAVPPLASLAVILRLHSVDSRVRLNQLAWFGGVALFFITLIFPVQFSREWLTIGWALEGAALLWLFHRVPHAGLRLAGVGLLVAAFARLALNPAVLRYHPRSEAAFFNWYLYSYGVALVCCFAGAWLLRPPRERVAGLNAPPLLNTLGVILAFILLNIEIANFFSPPGSRVLAFEFSGNFARDMTYTIAWALFALALLFVCIWKAARLGRYAALALLGVAVLKLFFHDLARLEALYRIGALFGVAVIAIVASFAYQRFLPGNESHADGKQ